MQCGPYWRSRRASWTWFVDSSKISSQVRVVERPNFSPSWIRDTLGILKDTEVFTYSDSSRFSYEISDGTEATTPSQTVFKTRILLSELQEKTNVALLEFGSLYGPQRLGLTKKKNKNIRIGMEKVMFWEQPFLENVSEAIVERMGGRDAFFSAHLRLGKSRRDRFGVSLVLSHEASFRTNPLKMIAGRTFKRRASVSRSSPPRLQTPAIQHCSTHQFQLHYHPNLSPSGYFPPQPLPHLSRNQLRCVFPPILAQPNSLHRHRQYPTPRKSHHPALRQHLSMPVLSFRFHQRQFHQLHAGGGVVVP